jgi:hypothetical protein
MFEYNADLFMSFAHYIHCLSIYFNTDNSFNALQKNKIRTQSHDGMSVQQRAALCGGQMILIK